MTNGRYTEANPEHEVEQTGLALFEDRGEEVGGVGGRLAGRHGRSGRLDHHDGGGLLSVVVMTMTLYGLLYGYHTGCFQPSSAFAM